MFDDIWYYVFFYLTNDKDVFSVASVSKNFHQIIEKNMDNFEWFKFHKDLEKFDDTNHQFNKTIASYTSSKMGAKFELVKNVSLIHLLITDYTGMKKQIIISHIFNLRNPETFSELINGNHNTHQLFIHGEQLCFVVNFEQKTLSIHSKFDPLPTSFTYRINNTANLNHFNQQFDDYNLTTIGGPIFNLEKDLSVTVLFSRQRNRFNVEYFELIAIHNNSKTTCHYHCIPLKSHRIFVVQIKNQIYFLSVDIHDSIKCSILCKLTDSPNTWKKYLLDYSHVFGTLKIIKDFGDCLKIVKEIPIDESLS
jgi:hypothetical protein